jgi:hypothetical protein
MNDKEFRLFLKQKKKQERTINSYINSVKVLEDFIKTQGRDKKLGDVNPKDIRDFVSWGTKVLKNVYRCLWGIRAYYQFLQLDELEYTASELMEYVQNETRLLREFPKTDRDAVDKLALIGIKTVNQLLETCKTKRDREKLAEQSGTENDSILELVKMSNLSRLPGLKNVRCRLYYEGGLDTFSKIAALEPSETRSVLSNYIDRSGFEGSPPTENDAQYAITMARFLPEIVEF